MKLFQRLMGLTPLKKTIFIVALINFIYFGIEFISALSIASVSLLADSIDFLEDAAINCLILLTMGWSMKKRAIIGLILSFIILIPGLTTLWAVWQKLIYRIPPEPYMVSLIGFGALMVNSFCVYILIKYRHHHGSLTKAAFLSARNDVAANVMIIVAGLLTFWLHSIWPDLLIGIVIALLNIGAAKEVYQAAQQEYKS